VLGAQTGIVAAIPFGVFVMFSVGSAILLAQSSVGAAIALFGIGIAVLVAADYFVPPLIIGSAAKLPFLWVLFGIVGGCGVSVCSAYSWVPRCSPVSSRYGANGPMGGSNRVWAPAPTSNHLDARGSFSARLFQESPACGCEHHLVWRPTSPYGGIAFWGPRRRPRPPWVMLRASVAAMKASSTGRLGMASPNRRLTP
jgi:hypothetical protein